MYLYKYLIVYLYRYPFSIVFNSSNRFMQDSNSSMCKIARKFHQTFLGRNQEDIMTLLVTLMCGFVLYGRVDNGACNPSVIVRLDTQVSRILH
jgi:hypothetical protein